MGINATNALYAVSYETDKVKLGETNYHKNFNKWLKAFQESEWVASCAQTDMKGERLKRLGQQTGLGMYTRVVETRSDGIVVKGCKINVSETFDF